jgi:hypothetical protein
MANRKTPSPRALAFSAFVEADRKWVAALRERYGRRALAVRYTREAENGTPTIARLWTAREAAFDAWSKGWIESEEGAAA